MENKKKTHFVEELTQELSLNCAISVVCRWMIDVEWMRREKKTLWKVSPTRNKCRCYIQLLIAIYYRCRRFLYVAVCRFPFRLFFFFFCFSLCSVSFLSHSLYGLFVIIIPSFVVSTLNVSNEYENYWCMIHVQFTHTGIFICGMTDKMSSHI